MTAPAIDVRPVSQDEAELSCIARIPATAPECGAVATWVGIIKCCGAVRPMCDAHKAHWFDNRIRVIECGACKHTHFGFPFAAVERL